MKNNHYEKINLFAYGIKFIKSDLYYACLQKG